MKAIFLARKATPENAFEFREVEIPEPGADQVLIRVEGFGLNFADIVSREGMYRDAPPMPFVPGYEVVGRIETAGKNVDGLKPGDRVAAFTRFGGYAEFALTDSRAAFPIPESMSIAAGTALTTQYCTAYYSAAIAANLREKERVVVHSAAGGVGTALLQYALHLDCEVIATTGSASKAELLKKLGAQNVIVTSSSDFYTEAKHLSGGKGVDVIFDALGGIFVKQGIRLLSAGGRLVCYGASQMTGTNIFGRIKSALQFGIYHPAQFMMSSKSLLGVNMLRIGDEKPDLLRHCLEGVMKLHDAGVFIPAEGKIFSASQIAEAHRYLQERKATGKVALKWD